MENRRSEVEVEADVSGGELVAEGAPTFAEVVRHVQVPALLPPKFEKVDPILEEGGRQTAALGRIAEASEAMVQCWYAYLAHQQHAIEAAEDQLWWTKALVGTVILAPIVTALVLAIFQ